MSKEASRLLVTSWFDLPPRTPRIDTWLCGEAVRGRDCAGQFRRVNDFDAGGMRIVEALDVDWVWACPDCRRRYVLLGLEEPEAEAVAGVDLIG